MNTERQLKKIQLTGQKGFAFLPIIIVVAALIVGTGASVVATKKFSGNKIEEPVTVLENESIETEVMEIQNPTTAPTTTATIEVDETSIANRDTPPVTKEVPQAINVPESINESVQVLVPETSVETTTQAPTPVITNTSVVEEVTSTTKDKEVPTEAEVTQAQQLTYNQVKTESATLTKGMDTVIEQYEKKKEIVEQNLENCTTKYENGVAQAEVDAEYLKTTYAESRSGFASSPSMYDNIDTALESDLNQLETEFEYCKTAYQLDTSIESDIKQIDRKQNNIMVKLSLENAADSLDTIRELQQNLLDVADRVW